MAVARDRRVKFKIILSSGACDTNKKALATFLRVHSIDPSTRGIQFLEQPTDLYLPILSIRDLQRVLMA